MKKLQSIVEVIDEVDTAAIRNDGHSKECARPYRLQCLCSYLSPSRCCFDNVAIAAVHSQNIAIWCNRKSERAVDVYIRRHVFPCESGGFALERVGDGRDAAIHGVSDVEGAVTSKPYTGRPHYQC